MSDTSRSASSTSTICYKKSVLGGMGIKYGKGWGGSRISLSRGSVLSREYFLSSWYILQVLFVLSTDSLLCDMLVTFGSFVCYINTHTRLTALFPELPRWAGTRKVKPIWISKRQWVAVASAGPYATASLHLAPADNHTITPPLCFYRPDALPAAQPTASKHWRHKHWRHVILNKWNK